MRQAYNRSYRPPIPALTIRLYSLAADKFTSPITAIIDTGSDASLIPMELLNELGAEETAPGWLISITGERKPVPLYFVDVYIDDQALSGIRVIGDRDGDEVILGRDVLNKLALFLDGPQGLATIPDDKLLNRLRRDRSHARTT